MRVRNIHRNIYSRNSEFENLKISIDQHKKSLKIPKGYSESVYRRRTENTMTKRKCTKGQTAIYKTYTYN